MMSTDSYRSIETGDFAGLININFVLDLF